MTDLTDLVLTIVYSVRTNDRKKVRLNILDGKE